MKTLWALSVIFVHLLVLSVDCPRQKSSYRWPSSKFTHLLQEIDKVQQQYYITEIIVTRDINFPLPNWNSFSSTSDYEDSIAGMFVNSGFEQIRRKTRKRHSESADPAKALNLSLAKQTNKQTDKQKILATQRFELSTLAFLAQFSYRLSYRAVLI